MSLRWDSSFKYQIWRKRKKIVHGVVVGRTKGKGARKGSTVKGSTEKKSNPSGEGKYFFLSFRWNYMTEWISTLVSQLLINYRMVHFLRRCSTFLLYVICYLNLDSYSTGPFFLSWKDLTQRLSDSSGWITPNPLVSSITFVSRRDIDNNKKNYKST